VLLVLGLFGLAGFYYEQQQQQEHQQHQHQHQQPRPPAAAASRPAQPDEARVAAAHAAALSALASEPQHPVLPAQSASTAPTVAAEPRAAAAAPTTCRWPAAALDLAPGTQRTGADAGCRPFVGLLVPCTTAKTCDRKGNCWSSVDDTSLIKELVPSVFSTLGGCTAECECQRPDCRSKMISNGPPAAPTNDLVFYIGYDGGDKIYDTDAAREQLPQRFAAALQASGDGGSETLLPRIGLRLVRCAESHSMVANSNCLSSAAHADGAEYTYRVNDDTVFETPGWLDTLPAALKSLEPPNVGVSGPRATGGNWKILTYDMVHRTHMEIFGGQRYPPSLQNWYSDDWITKVYSGDYSEKGPRWRGGGDHKQGRMVMLAETSVKHTRTVDHTRYMPDHSGKTALPGLLDAGAAAVAKYLAQHTEPGSARASGAADTQPPAIAVAATAAPPAAARTHGGDVNSQQKPDPATSGGQAKRKGTEMTSAAASKTAEAIGALGECPDGKWELRGTQLVCPSAAAVEEAGPTAQQQQAAVGGGAAGEAAAQRGGGSEDAVGAADERLSTRLNPNRERSVCQLPAGRAKLLTDEQRGRLRSDWCKSTAGIRRQLPSGGRSLTAAVHDAEEGGQEIRASCATGELRWSDQGRAILSAAYGLGASKESAAWVAAHGSAWRTMPRGKELVLPFVGGMEYVEVECALPKKTKQQGAAAVSTADDVGEYDWAAREVFLRFVPAPEREVAPSLATSVGGGRVGPDGLNIVVLMVDSLSRAQAMALMPQLRRLLQETAPSGRGGAGTAAGPGSTGAAEPTHSSYVFDHAGVVGTHSGTNSNMGALFAGRKYNFARDDLARVATLVAPWGKTRMLWDELQEQGYVTAGAFAFGDLWGASYWNSSFHHLAPAKYDVRGGSYADHDPVLASWDERQEPFCVGGRLSSDIDTAWMEGFLRAYPARKKFLYAHFMEGHNAPEAAAQLDENLVKVVRAAMAQPRTAVYVASDHGGLPRDLPLSALFLPRAGFLSEHVEVGEALRSNQHQYVTHYDMRATLRHLSRWPEPPPKEVTVPQASASLLGPLGARRDCSVDIGDGHCICRQWTTCTIGCTRAAEREAAEASLSGGSGAVGGVATSSEEAEVLAKPDSEPGAADAKRTVRRARETAEAVTRQFNRELISIDIGGGASCRRLSVNSLTHVRSQQLAGGAALVYVEFTARESSYARFFASATFAGDAGEAGQGQQQQGSAQLPSPTVESSGQLTSYQPFRECADARLPLPFCVCKDL
jgi:hypothetical protein